MADAIFSVAIFLCLVMCLSVTDSSSISTDREALLAIKSSIISDPYGILAANWSSNTSVCYWHGVYCSRNVERVVSLSFRNMGLRGTIAPHVGNLSCLASLDFGQNKFQGKMPEELVHLRNLKRLYLDDNEFDGDILSSLGDLFNLRYLHLENNSFSGVVPRSIGNMSKLEVLNLSFNFLQGGIPEGIGRLSGLRRLSIIYNQLSGSMPLAILNMSTLQDIDLSGNQLSGTLLEDMCDRLPQLERLVLSQNKFHGKIWSAVKNCKKLKYLSLAKNGFYGSIPREIGNLTMLKHLSLGATNLTGGLPNEIGRLINLKELNLHEGRFNGPLPFSLFNISKLEMIDLYRNEFSGHLPSSMGRWLPNLRTLVLSYNNFSGKIPESTKNASKLVTINLTSNFFSGPVPDSLGELEFLERLLLGGNNLTREYFTPELRFLTSLTNCRNLKMLGFALNPLDGFLPASLGNLSSSLQHLQAFGSKIRGTIPIGVGNWSNLRYLGLDNNELTGLIPSSIGGLHNLEVLYLENNKLIGHIPDDLCALKNLGDLYVSQNGLNGSIPACLGGLKSLQRLYLDSNKLTSTIQSALWSLKDLVLLNLSRNSLSGELQSAIESFKVLTLLDLSYNQLSGYIPKGIGGTQQLSSLYLSHNKFQGYIPESVGDLIGLEFLDLSDNKLSGSIPKSIEKLRYLQYLNVSLNRLEGEIPGGGSFKNFTALSFMGNDALCGTARLQVPRCKSRTTSTFVSKLVSLLKYILPFVALALILAALIITLLRSRNRNIRPSTTGDSMLLEWRRVSYNELLQATEFFSESNLLGTGGFGSVFKGTLSDGKITAIKVLKLEHEGALKSFKAECDVLQQIRHRNIVPVISSCTNLDFRALVLEFMPNGSLEKWLYSHNNYLDMFQRLNIMIDVGLALEYLHHGQGKPILHCDLKPSNVLLDEDMVAHVGDFGLAKILGEEEFMERTVTLATIGYMAPEYGQEGLVSTSGDVYSYGIVLMEAFTRKKPTDEMFSDEMSLRSWINVALHGSTYDVVDKNLLAGDAEHLPAKEQCLFSVLSLALDCTMIYAAERPSMEDVVVRLQKIRAVFQARLSGLVNF